MRDLKSVLKSKKALIVSAVTAATLMAVYFVFFGNMDADRGGGDGITPPVVAVNPLNVAESAPSGKIQYLNSRFPVKIKFDQKIDPQANTILISIEPAIAFEKYTLTSDPTIVWLEPSPTKSNGWEFDTNYTITVASGSRTQEGNVLKGNYTFSFINSISDNIVYPD